MDHDLGTVGREALLGRQAERSIQGDVCLQVLDRATPAAHQVLALARSPIQVTFGGAVVATVGVLVGQARPRGPPVTALLPFSIGHGAVFLCPRARFMGPVGLLRKVIGYDPAKGR